MNWFRKDADGRFLWPGFGDNSRVLAWVFDRVDGRGEHVETPIGILPQARTMRVVITPQLKDLVSESNPLPVVVGSFVVDTALDPDSSTPGLAVDEETRASLVVARLSKPGDALEPVHRSDYADLSVERARARCSRADRDGEPVPP